MGGQLSGADAALKAIRSRRTLFRQELFVMIKIEHHEQVSAITLNDGKVNALNLESFTVLKTALEECRDKRAVVLTGEGKCFSAGLDLKTLIKLSESELVAVLNLFSEVMQELLTYPCPVVAAINGHAIAGGAVISLCCDHVLGVEKELKIGLSEVSVGMSLPKAVVELARHRLSPTRLNEAVLFGRMYSWQEALAVGYFHETVEEGALREKALERARQLAALPSHAFQQTKLTLNGHLPKDMASDAASSFLSEEARKHMAAFS